MKKNVFGPLFRDARLYLSMSEDELSRALKGMGVQIHPGDIQSLEQQTRVIWDFELLALTIALRVNPKALQDYIASTSAPHWESTDCS